MVTAHKQQELDKIDLAGPPAPPPIKPGTASPWEFASFLVGMPGAVICVALTLILAMLGTQGYQPFAWISLIALYSAYFGTMVMLWLATATDYR